MILFNDRLYDTNYNYDIKRLEKEIYDTLKEVTHITDVSKVSNRINQKLSTIKGSELEKEVAGWDRFGLEIEYIPNENNLYQVLHAKGYGLLSAHFHVNIDVLNDYGEHVSFIQYPSKKVMGINGSNKVKLGNGVIFGTELVKLGFSMINAAAIYYMTE